MSTPDLCTGVLPLTARLEPWQQELLDDPQGLTDLVADYGSPVNLIDPAPLGRNAGELLDVARRHGVDLGVFFARKANKALALVDEADALGLGVDVASEAELRQVLDRGVPGPRIILSAAVKPAPLLELALQTETTISIDNEDELALLQRLSVETGQRARIALRLAPDLGTGIETRFGVSAQLALVLADGLRGPHAPVIDGVHFHLDGYAAAHRVEALTQSLALIDALVARGHQPQFIDIGGGVPMSYLDSPVQWRAFWAAHNKTPLTFGGHPLGTVYPYHQAPVRGAWLDQVLSADVGGGHSVARALGQRGLQLRCEPGRSLLDGCGLTAARVEFRKQRRDGAWLIGLAMNRTQCRSTSDDFMVDPLLVRSAETADGEEIEGYLVGAYCIERELLTLRRLRFPRGVAVGDIVVFPNTAGYLMHILESSSHQIPLAQNVVLRRGTQPELDAIDRAATPA